MKIFDWVKDANKKRFKILGITIVKIFENGNRKKYYILGVQIFTKKIKNSAPSPSILCSKNKELHNIANKKRCFILATGPSIKQQDLTKLQGEDVFSISNFFLHKDINIIKPKFHFFAPYHEPLILENYINWLKLADEKLPRETNIVLASCNEYLVKEYGLFPTRTIFYVDLKPIDLESPLNTDITLPVMAPQTGPIMILPVCDYMGYKEIYLVGQDMNRLANYGGTTQNFYDNDPRKNATDANNWIDIIPEMERTLIMFKQFKKYADYFQQKEIKFYNLSPASWLSFIEKKDFNNVLENKENICKNQS